MFASIVEPIELTPRQRSSLEARISPALSCGLVAVATLNHRIDCAVKTYTVDREAGPGGVVQGLR
jgi:hypothetical protein